MKISIQLLIFCLLNVSFLQSQTFPIEVQKMLSATKSPQHASKSIQNRGNALPCVPDSILSYTYASNTDSTFVGYSDLTENTDDNSVDTKSYRVNSLNNQLYLTNKNRSVFNDQNNVIYSEFIGYGTTGIENFGGKTDFFLNPITQKEDSIISYNKITNTTMWEKTFKTANTHNANGQLIETLDYYWVGNNWAFNTKTISLFGTNNKISTFNSYLWSNSWELKNSRIFTYDNNDSLAQVLLIELPSGDTISKEVYTYTNLTTKVETFNWNTDSQTWVFNSFYNFDLDSKSRNTHFEYFYQSGIVTNGGIFDYYYGATDEDCLSLLKSQVLNNGNLEDIAKDYFIYDTSIPTKTPLKDENWSIYPNPNDGIFEINAPLGSSISISNSIGTVILSQKCVKIKSLVNLTQFPAGFYSILIKNGNKYEIKKMVKN
jgi:Secretion system C-terminal sorting domain